MAVIQNELKKIQAYKDNVAKLITDIQLMERAGKALEEKKLKFNDLSTARLKSEFYDSSDSE
jgi:NAD(P)H-hydrate repair Nnr-like enzyme with NAD(P)H-hydrate epimerase domain